MKFKAPTKESYIYRIVSWLNTTLIGEGKEPKNVCQLFWQSIGWFLVTINVVCTILLVLALPFTGIANYPDTVMPFVYSGVLTLGAVASMFISLYLIIIWGVLTTKVFWLVILSYILCCVLYKQLPKEYKNNTTPPFSLRGIELIIVGLRKIISWFGKIKGNFDCEDIK